MTFIVSKRSIPVSLSTLVTAVLCLAFILATLGSFWVGTGSFSPKILGVLLTDNTTQSLLLTQSWAPRWLTSLVAGAGLAVAGTLLQHALKNPLASPSTLGLAGGAKLALTLATLYAPWLLSAGTDIIALAGAIAIGGLVFLLARKSGFVPVMVILTGMILALYCGSVTTALAIIRQEWLTSLFIWGSGDLTQNGWYVIMPLMLKVAIGIAFGIVLARPVEMLSLNEDQSRAFGAHPARLRLACLLIGGWLTAIIVASVGIIAFIGLAGPAIARLSGKRRLRHRMIHAAIYGALLLCCADQSVQLVAGYRGTLIPVGAITGLFGAPLLILLVGKMRNSRNSNSTTMPLPTLAARHVLKWIAIVFSTIAILTALLIGRDVAGHWNIVPGPDFMTLWPWRGPRVFGAMAAGAMLAIAGTILQRMTANPMASPESLGISAGAAVGMIVVLFTVAAPTGWMQIGGATTGAALTLLALFLLARKSGYSPERILIAGIALSALFDGFISFLMAGGDPRAMRLLNWSAGSLYGLEFDRAILLLAVTLVFLPVLPALTRWLNLFPLGSETTKTLGVDLTISRSVLLLCAAILTGAATLLIGPLSFAGLIAPHLARFAGFNRALSQGYGAALIGAALMVLADWMGRMLFFPWDVPAGLMAALIGGPLLVWLLLRTQRRQN
jgi:iron complex transport system permease protein